MLYSEPFTEPDLSGPKNSFESVISYQQDTN